MKRRFLCNGTLCLFLLLPAASALAQPGPAENQPAGGPDACPVPGPRMQLVGRASRICVPVAQKIWTTLSIPPGVEVFLPDDSPFERNYQREARMLHLMARPGIAEGITDTIKILGPDYSATVVLFAATRARSEIVVEYITEDEQRRRQDEARKLAEEQARRKDLEQRIAAMQSTIATMRGKNADTARALASARARLAALAGELAASKTARAAMETQLATIQQENTQLEREVGKLESDLLDTRRALAEASQAASANRRAWLIDAYHRQQRGGQVLRPVIDGWIPVDGASVDVRFQEASWLGESLVLPVDIRAEGPRPLPIGGIRVLDEHDTPLPSHVLEPTGRENEQKGILTTVPEGGSARVVLAVDVPPGVCAECLRIEFTEYGSSTAPVFAQIPRYTLVPVTPEQEKLERWDKQLVLAPTLSAGGCWRADSPGSPNLDSMTCYGLGLRITKGISDMFSIGGEVLGGRTAGSEMDGATFGRATLNGYLRFGSYTVTYVRLGIGAQVVRVDGSTEVSPSWTAGVGAERRLGEHLLVGLELGYGAGDATVFRQVVLIGAHLGIGLNVDSRGKKGKRR